MELQTTIQKVIIKSFRENYSFVSVMKNILMLEKKKVKLTVPVLALLTVLHFKGCYGNVYDKCKLVAIPE